MQPNISVPKQAIGEAAITPQLQQAVAPDVASQQGQAILSQKAQEAEKAKPYFEKVLKNIASKVDGSQSARVKQIDTAAQKIAQKRLQGRQYEISDIGDMLGGRITVDDKSQIALVKKLVENQAADKKFLINKSEDASHGTYKGWHFDITLPSGVKTELQIHTPQSELEATANHTLRSMYGESPENKAVRELRDKQASIAQSVPNDKAKKAIEELHGFEKQQGGMVSPIQSAQVLSQASK